MMLTRTCDSPELDHPTAYGACDYLQYAVPFDVGMGGIGRMLAPGHYQATWSARRATSLPVPHRCGSDLCGVLSRTSQAHLPGSAGTILFASSGASWSRVLRCVGPGQTLVTACEATAFPVPPRFRREFPIFEDPTPGASLRGLCRPHADRPDAEAGLMPQRAFRMLRDRREEEVQLPPGSFEMPR
jgi:hypothetical protein